MDFRHQNAGVGRLARALRAAQHHLRWRQMCLEAIEDHRDLEGFAALHGLTEIETAIATAPFMKGSVERELLRRAAYHELTALYALRQTDAGTCDRARSSALREFLRLGREPADEAAQPEIIDCADRTSSANDDDKPPGRHPPPNSGRPRVKRVTRTRKSGSRRGGHGSSCPGAAAAAMPRVLAL